MTKSDWHHMLLGATVALVAIGLIAWLTGCAPMGAMAPYSAVLQGQESAYYRPPVYYYPPPQRVGPMPGFAPWSSSPQMRCVQLGPYLQCH